MTSHVQGVKEYAIHRITLLCIFIIDPAVNTIQSTSERGGLITNLLEVLPNPLAVGILLVWDYCVEGAGTRHTSQASHPPQLCVQYSYYAYYCHKEHCVRYQTELPWSWADHNRILM